MKNHKIPCTSEERWYCDVVSVINQIEKCNNCTFPQLQERFNLFPFWWKDTIWNNSIPWHFTFKSNWLSSIEEMVVTNDFTKEGLANESESPPRNGNLICS